ncbi:MAG TPA: PRC-barrel domain-containing protein [Methanobacterium sp.]
MKVTDFLGRRVVDRKAIEIGKVSDVIIEPAEAVLTGIVISTGEFGLRRTDLFITPSEIEEVGDYVLLKVKKSEIKGVKEEEKEEKATLKL